MTGIEAALIAVHNISDGKMGNSNVSVYNDRFGRLGFYEININGDPIAIGMWGEDPVFFCLSGRRDSRMIKNLNILGFDIWKEMDVIYFRNKVGKVIEVTSSLGWYTKFPLERL